MEKDSRGRKWRVGAWDKSKNRPRRDADLAYPAAQILVNGESGGEEDYR
jgi:hypothetical protein